MAIVNLVASVARALRRRVPVVFAESPESVIQPLVLRFPERTAHQAVIPTTALETAIRAMADAQRGEGGRSLVRRRTNSQKGELD